MLACVDLPAFPLQLLLRAHPEWKDDPVVVVEDDRPLAPILWSNRAARAQRIRRGMRFAHARALSATLHAEVVPEQTIERAIDELFTLLLAFSPHVEPVLAQPGLFWLDARGLSGLFGDLERWAKELHEKLSEQRYVAAVVVGFERGSTYALACMQVGPLVLRDRDSERRNAARVPLARLGVSAKLCDELALLDIREVAELLALEASQLLIRYGEEAARLHAFLSGRAFAPLLPRAPIEPLRVVLEVDPPDDDSARLLFGWKGALQTVVERLRKEQRAITALELRFELERKHAVALREGDARSASARGTADDTLRIETAAPTLDVVQIVDLLRLRMQNVALPSRVERIVTTLEQVRVHPRQIAIAHGEKPRDLEAAARAIARLRAAFGAESVTRVQLCDAHLPEAAFRFEPVRELRLPRVVSQASSPPLVRRLYAMPRALPAMPTHEPETWLGTHGAVTTMLGPHRVVSKWWADKESVERDYYFVETQTGELLWLFYDRARRRWFLHGAVD